MNTSADDPHEWSARRPSGSAADSAKSQVRRRLRARRAQLTPEVCAERAGSLAQHALADVPTSALLVGYLPMPGEPDLRPMLTQHLHRGGAVLVPRILGGAERRELGWVHWHPEAALQTSAYAPVQEPVGEARDLHARLQEHADRSGRQHGEEPTAVLLVPALAVDSGGARLGQGGGYYDRLAAALVAAPPVITPALWAVVHAEEVLTAGAFPAEAHDLRAERILTEDGIESIGA